VAGQHAVGCCMAYRVYQTPLDLLRHLDEVGVRIALLRVQWSLAVAANPYDLCRTSSFGLFC